MKLYRIILLSLFSISAIGPNAAYKQRAHAAMVQELRVWGSTLSENPGWQAYYREQQTYLLTESQIDWWVLGHGKPVPPTAGRLKLALVAYLQSRHVASIPQAMRAQWRILLGERELKRLVKKLWH